MDLSQHPNAKGFEFPTELVVIAVGPATLEFRAAVEAAVLRAGAQRTAVAISARESRGGRYLSVHVPIHVASRAELERIYAEVNAVPGLRFKF
jgi:uncharacterized protein